MRASSGISSPAGRADSRCRPGARGGSRIHSRISSSPASSSSSAPIRGWSRISSHSCRSAAPGLARIALGDRRLADVVQQPGEADVLDHVLGQVRAPGRSAPRSARRPASGAPCRRRASRARAPSRSRARSPSAAVRRGLARRGFSSSTDYGLTPARARDSCAGAEACKGKGPPCGGPLGHGKRGCPRERICDFLCRASRRAPGRPRGSRHLERLRTLPSLRKGCVEDRP